MLRIIKMNQFINFMSKFDKNIFINPLSLRKPESE
jgi:hypothetical protein